MESRVKLLGHPVHQMLIVLPVGLLAMAAIFDGVALVRAQGYWSEVALWMIVAGLVSGLAAAPFGLVDWIAIPAGTRAKRIGAIHGLGNVVMLAMFALSAWLRWAAPQTPPSVALASSFAGFGLVVITGWLGGELVDRLGIGIDAGANVDAPSSLGHRDAA